MTGTVALQVRDAQRVYGATTALAGASLRVCTGELHGLLGENGAGKSTLVRLLAGLEDRDGGDIEVFGRPLPGHVSPRQVRDCGLAFIHQDLGLVESMSVIDNIAFFTGFPKRFGFINYRAARARATAALDRVGFPARDVTADVGRLPLAMRSLVAIARALAVDARLIVLDEPTAALQAQEAAVLFESLSSLTREGVACLLITHRMDEVMQLCERVTVLRNGVDVGTRVVCESSRAELVSMITGGAALEPDSAGTGQPPEPSWGTQDSGDVLTMTGLRGEATGPLDIRVPAGQVTAVTGLADCGHLALGRQVCGLEPVVGGSLALHGRPFAPRGMNDCLAAGVGYVPPDRLDEGLAANLTLAENVYLNPTGRWWSPMGVRTERARATTALENALVQPADPDRTMSTLSGGNQQKVLLAKVLARQPSLLVLCEPSAGVDAGAKEQIQKMIRQSCRATGMAVLLISSDFEEVAEMSDRALVLSKGRLLGELRGEELSMAAVTALCFGTGDDQ